MNDAARRSLRTFIQVFVGVFAVSLLGFLGQVQEWSSCVGEVCQFPDPSVLAKAAVSAVAAGAASLVSFLQNYLEDNTAMPALLKAPASDGTNPVPE